MVALTSSNSKFLNGIGLLRAVAVLFVMYAHLVGQNDFIVFSPKTLLSDYFFEPLRIFQHGGALGVAIFFLVSGYIIPYVARHEALKEFALKRFFRIYPPFIFSILSIVAAYLLLTALQIKPYGFMAAEYFTLENTVLSASLANYFSGVTNINGVAWTLKIEVFFYAWIALIMGLLYKRTSLAILLTFAWSVFIFQSPLFCNYQVEVLNNFIFICFMFLGTLIYLRQAGLISKYQLFFWTPVFWLLFMHQIDMRFVPHAPQYETPGYAVSYGFAYLLFVAAIFLEPKIRLGTISRHIADRSYSLYLFHGTVGGFITGTLHKTIGTPLALLLAFAAVFMFSHFAHHFIEKPSQVLARKLLKMRITNPRLSPSNQ